MGNPTAGSDFALNSITAAVLGGASLAGGRATFVGSSVAAVLLALIITVLPFLGLGPDDGLIIIGVLVLAGIILFQLGDLKELVKRYKAVYKKHVGDDFPQDPRKQLMLAINAVFNSWNGKKAIEYRRIGSTVRWSVRSKLRKGLSRSSMMP